MRCKDHTPISGSCDRILRVGQPKRFSTGGFIVEYFEIRTQTSKGGGDWGDIRVNFDSHAKYDQAMNTEKVWAIKPLGGSQGKPFGQYNGLTRGCYVNDIEVNCDAVDPRPRPRKNRG